MKAIPDLKGVCLCNDKAGSLCNALNIFDDGMEKNEFSVSQDIAGKRFYHLTTAEIVYLFSL